MGAGDVQSAFDYFDVDGDGNIEYEEFVNALKALEIGLSDDQVPGSTQTCTSQRDQPPLGPARGDSGVAHTAFSFCSRSTHVYCSRACSAALQVFELMRGLDKDCDSTIDLEEFASRFAPVFTRLNMKQDVSARHLCLQAPTRSCMGHKLRTGKHNRPLHCVHGQRMLYSTLLSSYFAVSTMQIFCPVENTSRTGTSLLDTCGGMRTVRGVHHLQLMSRSRPTELHVRETI